MKQLLILLLIFSTVSLAATDGTNLAGGIGDGNGAGYGGQRGKDGGLLFIKVLGVYDGENGIIDVSGENGTDGSDALLASGSPFAVANTITSGSSANFGSGILITNTGSQRQDVSGLIFGTTWSGDDQEIYEFDVRVGNSTFKAVMSPSSAETEIRGQLLPGESVFVENFSLGTPQFSSIEIDVDITNSIDTIAGGGGGGPGGHAGKLVIEYNKLLGNGTYLTSGGLGGLGGRGQNDASNGQEGESGGLGEQDIKFQNAIRLANTENNGFNEKIDISLKNGPGFYVGKIQSRKNYVLFENDRDKDFTKSLFLQNFFDIN